MKRLLSFSAIAFHILAAFCLSVRMARAATPFATDLFVGGQGGYHAYRIPAMSVSPQGSLIVFCEARKSSLSDHGDIDLLLRRSEDGGRTWLAPRLVIEEGGDAPIKYGNPTAVVDRETGSIWLAVNRDYLDPRGRRQGGRPLLLRSDDDGNSWLNPIDIYGADEKTGWKHYAFGPGIRIQLQHGRHQGRLILPANYRESFDKRQPSWSHVIFSDDHGRSLNAVAALGERPDRY